MISMLLTSNKQMFTLLKDFTRHPRTFESYSKHCQNILNSLSWLQDHQFDDSCDSYEYLVKLLSCYKCSDVVLQDVFSDYQKEVVDKVLERNKKTLHSNLYYYDLVASQSSLKDLDSLVSTSPKTPVYRRLEYTILNPLVDLDLNREYSFEEIYQLAREGIITVLDSHLSSSKSSLQEDGRVYLNYRNPYWIGVNDSKTIDQLSSIPNLQAKEKWGTIFEPFCQFVKKQAVSFSPNPEKRTQFNDIQEVEDHLQSITGAMERYYRKHQTLQPEIVARTVIGNKDAIYTMKKKSKKESLPKTLQKTNISSVNI